ncbi:MAG: DUF983 domain-containing protein [Parvularculaceae bacterium]
MTYYPPVSPISVGLAGKCPRCGQGALFGSFIGLNDKCDVCGLDYSKADAGDGPAVFIMFVVGFIAVAVAFVAQFVFFASILISFLISAFVAIALSLLLLRPFKGILVALQYKHKAEEGRLEE